MEEKVYVVSEPIHFKNIIRMVMLIGLFVALFVLFPELNRVLDDYIDGDLWFSEMFEEMIPYIVVVGFGYGIFLLACFLLNWAFSKMSIVVTDKRVYGTSYFGQRVDLPFDSITAVSTGWFSGVRVSTASGVIKFYLLKNSNVIYDVINSLLIQRQSKEVEIKEVVQTPEVKSAAIDVTEEIRKYKALLDDEIITKKEFEEKKKELLNLK